MQVQTTTVTPKMAKEFLSVNLRNRPLSQHTVENFARTMEEGDWAFNGDSICFDSDGNLIDGQHRLHACVISNIPFKALVVKGLDPNSFETKDQRARPRKFSDVLAMKGEKHYNVLSAVINLQCIYNFFLKNGSVAIRTGSKGARFVPNIANLEETLEKNPNIRNSVFFCVNPIISGLINASPAAFIHYNASRFDQALADQFIIDIAEGINLGRNNVAKLTRDRLIANKASVVKIPSTAKIQLLTTAWNKYYRGETANKLMLPINRKAFAIFEGDIINDENESNNNKS